MNWTSVRSPQGFVKNEYSNMPAAQGCGTGRRLVELCVAESGGEKERVKNSFFFGLKRERIGGVGSKWGIFLQEVAGNDWLVFV
jgi:hypothetical protein